VKAEKANLLHPLPKENARLSYKATLVRQHTFLLHRCLIFPSLHITVSNPDSQTVFLFTTRILPAPLLSKAALSAIRSCRNSHFQSRAVHKTTSLALLPVHNLTLWRNLGKEEQSSSLSDQAQYFCFLKTTLV